MAGLEATVAAIALARKRRRKAGVTRNPDDFGFGNPGWETDQTDWGCLGWLELVCYFIIAVFWLIWTFCVLYLTVTGQLGPKRRKNKKKSKKQKNGQEGEIQELDESESESDDDNLGFTSTFLRSSRARYRSGYVWVDGKPIYYSTYS